jgi:hypothetical protein
MLQIGYLDSSDASTPKHLICFVINLAYDELTEKRYEKLQTSPICHDRFRDKSLWIVYII